MELRDYVFIAFAVFLTFLDDIYQGGSNHRSIGDGSDLSDLIPGLDTETNRNGQRRLGPDSLHIVIDVRQLRRPRTGDAGD